MSDVAGQAASAAANSGDSVANAAVGGDQQTNSTQQDQGQSQETNSDPPINPAWNKMLEGIPSSLHPMVTPHLRDWDKNFQTKLSEVQSQYAQFEPFKDTPAETLEQALNFYKVMEANPQAVYDQMAEYYGFGAGDQGQQVQESGDPDVPEFDLDSDDIMQNPKVQELLKNQEVMAQFLVSQQQKEQQAEFEAQIDTEVSQIKEANPDFDESDETLMFQIAAASNISLTEAANQVKAYADSRVQRSAAPKAPSVMGAGGFVPAAENVDPRKLDRNGTRSLVADLLTQARQNG